ncbi:MAG: CopD family protein [Acidisphaera sp.]|nr:CopD family protein [Acidisphaera sp.]
MISGSTTADLLLALHLLGVVTWVGGMLFAYIVLRPSLAVLPPPSRIALHRQVFRRFFLVVWHAMPLVLLSGYAMLFGYLGGFAGAPWNINVMHLLGLIMAAIFLAVVFGPWAAMRRGDDEAAPASIERIRQLILANLVLGLIVIVVATLN